MGVSSPLIMTRDDRGRITVQINPTGDGFFVVTVLMKKPKEEAACEREHTVHPGRVVFATGPVAEEPNPDFVRVPERPCSLGTSRGPSSQRQASLSDSCLPVRDGPEDSHFSSPAEWS